jgi:hypothetical protein
MFTKGEKELENPQMMEFGPTISKPNFSLT